MLFSSIILRNPGISRAAATKAKSCRTSATTPQITMSDVTRLVASVAASGMASATKVPPATTPVAVFPARTSSRSLNGVSAL